MTAPPARLRAVTVFCGASPGCGDGYARAAEQLGLAIAESGLDLVYGGAAVGLMGTVADAALHAGGTVTGVIPRAMLPYEIAHAGLTDLHVVPDMHARKALMAQLGDAFVTLPGGLGTAEEFFEALTWSQLRLHDKPCVLLDVDGFYRPLRAFLDHAVLEGFVAPRDVARLIVCQHADEVVPALRRAVASTGR
ncbi:LOG family protein [Streptomyces millisiae]|uniref:Cytokinin riboside 5'-monophosphate phosphoribohydrolase n=1 Tax=Streptomyces millisiae TaxID=3075542 RepID=A0ABU2M0F7_9ACTN|nr:TIGR00730 family Rossman fold protein [Streptomyces sp. DSM 44918]MDT0323043.1 TIGR00730 family Rossman fold protein [Streptomyces sp. DSM 44918]